MIVSLPDLTPSIDPTAYVAPTATIVGDVTIGPHASVWFGAVLRAENAPITVGEGANVQDNAVFHTDEGHPVHVGAGVSVGHAAVIHGATIGDHSLIGMGAVVLNGATIGGGTLVAAGAVVSQGAEVPERSLVAGVPGRVRRELTDEQVDGLRDNANTYRDRIALYAAAEVVA